MSVKLPALLVVWFLKVSQLCETLMQGQYLKPGDMKGKRENSGSMAATNGQPASDDLYATLTTTHRGFETPCGSYAHLKLTRYLLRITRDGRYGDSMEQVVLNTVLGAKKLQDDGRAFYYSDYNFKGSRTYFPDRWPCCSGTLPQVAADYHVLVFFRDPEGIYVNLYTPSTGHWTAPNGARLALVQSGDYAEHGRVRLKPYPMTDTKVSRSDYIVEPWSLTLTDKEMP